MKINKSSRLALRKLFTLKRIVERDIISLNDRNNIQVVKQT